MSGTLRLWVDAQYSSPYAMSAYVALREKGLPFELRTVDLARGQAREPAYAGLSLSQRVPTLEHDGFALSESSAIAEYLEDTFAQGTALYPTDARERARARQLQAWLRSDFMPLRVQRTTEVVFVRPNPTPLQPDAVAAAGVLFAALERLLAPGSLQLFEHWSIADCDLALMIQRLLGNGDPVPALAADYARRQWERPSIRAWLALPRHSG